MTVNNEPLRKRNHSIKKKALQCFNKEAPFTTLQGNFIMHENSNKINTLTSEKNQRKIAPMNVQPESWGFCSGIGKYHSNKKGNNPYSQITFNQILEMTKHPQQVSKSFARWIIPSCYKGQFARSSRHQAQKGMYGLLWADIDEIGHSPRDINQALAGLGCEALLYTTASATKEKMKWRLIIPLAELIKPDVWHFLQNKINKKLINYDIQPDRSSEKLNQILFLPNAGEHYEYHKLNLEVSA